MKTQKFMGRGQLLDRLAAQVGSKNIAMSILMKRGQMDKGGNLTAKGEARNSMTASERAVDRAVRASGKPTNKYKYDPKTNRATLK